MRESEASFLQVEQGELGDGATLKGAKVHVQVVCLSVSSWDLIFLNFVALNSVSAGLLVGKGLVPSLFPPLNLWHQFSP